MRPDAEVLLGAVAQGQLAGWCHVPPEHLAWALPSWAAGPTAPAYEDSPRWNVLHPQQQHLLTTIDIHPE
ncbi:hypothetical protein ABT150_34290 [Streptomyces mirabilis]|uniref:hypothetical protein n=1 Tax=Streptomyces mirabilis TaxID=68239 RepID=UPI003317CC12